MTDTEGAENAEGDTQSAPDEATTDEATTDVDQEQEEEDTTGLDQEQADEGVTADYQTRIEEFDNVDTTPVESVATPGEPGTVEMPKSE